MAEAQLAARLGTEGEAAFTTWSSSPIPTCPSCKCRPTGAHVCTGQVVFGLALPGEIDTTQSPRILLHPLHAHFKEDAAHTPHVHLLSVVTICQEALRGAIPPRGDVLCVRLLAVDPPAAAKVCQLEALIDNQDVLRLDVPEGRKGFCKCDRRATGREGPSLRITTKRLD